MTRLVLAVLSAAGIALAGAALAQQPAPAQPTSNIKRDGQAPKVLKAGDSYQIPAGAIHDVKSSDKGMKVMAVYMVEKGKPLATPAP